MSKKQIEVEKKFLLTSEQIKQLTKGAKLIKSSSHTDTYFDTPDFKLTTKGEWLRDRSGKYEFKVPVKAKGLDTTTFHQELETEEEIREYLGLEKTADLEEDLKSNGYLAFATFTTQRTSYLKDGFHIDIDSVDFGYDLVEIELMVDDESKVAEASKKIMDYAISLGLDTKKVRGKLLEYILRNNPTHYQLLLAAGVYSE